MRGFLPARPCLSTAKAFLAGAAILAGAASQASSAPRSTSSGAELAMAVPRLSSAGDGGVALPRPLPPTTVRLLRTAFADAAAPVIGLDAEPLLGHVLAAPPARPRVQGCGRGPAGVARAVRGPAGRTRAARLAADPVAPRRRAAARARTAAVHRRLARRRRGDGRATAVPQPRSGRRRPSRRPPGPVRPRRAPGAAHERHLGRVWCPAPRRAGADAFQPG